MMIKYKCSRCKATLESPEGLGGKQDVCPICEQQCSVPLSKAQKRAARQAEKRRLSEQKQRERRREKRELADVAEGLRRQREAERQEAKAQSPDPDKAIRPPLPQQANAKDEAGSTPATRKTRRIGIGLLVATSVKELVSIGSVALTAAILGGVARMFLLVYYSSSGGLISMSETQMYLGFASTILLLVGGIIGIWGLIARSGSGPAAAAVILLGAFILQFVVRMSE